MMRTIVAAIFCLSLAAPARADAIFSNLGIGDSYVEASGWTIGGAESPTNIDSDQGSPFTPFGDFVLDSIEVAFTWAGGTNAGDIWLMSDVNAAPGDILETFHFTNLPDFGSTTNALATGVSTLRPLLLEGNQYWVVASASGDAVMVFNFNTTGDFGLAGRANGGPWVSNSSFDAGAFRVNGTPAVTAVPEPTSILLLGTGALALIRKRARRR
jgi:hypothetical protein